MIRYVAVYDSDDVYRILSTEKGIYHLESLDGAKFDIDAKNIDAYFETLGQALEWQAGIIPDDVPHPFFREDYPNLSFLKERAK